VVSLSNIDAGRTRHPNARSARVAEEHAVKSRPGKTACHGSAAVPFVANDHPNQKSSSHGTKTHAATTIADIKFAGFEAQGSAPPARSTPISR